MKKGADGIGAPPMALSRAIEEDVSIEEIRTRAISVILRQTACLHSGYGSVSQQSSLGPARRGIGYENAMRYGNLAGQYAQTQATEADTLCADQHNGTDCLGIDGEGWNLGAPVVAV